MSVLPEAFLSPGRADYRADCMAAWVGHAEREKALSWRQITFLSSGFFQGCDGNLFLTFPCVHKPRPMLVRLSSLAPLVFPLTQCYVNTAFR